MASRTMARQILDDLMDAETDLRWKEDEIERLEERLNDMLANAVKKSVAPICDILHFAWEWQRATERNDTSEAERYRYELQWLLRGSPRPSCICGRDCR